MAGSSMLAPARRWQSLKGAVLAFFEAYRADEPVAGTFRARQLQAVLRLTPLAMLTNLVNVSLVTISFWDTAHRSALLLWSALVAAVALRGVRAWRRWREGGAWRSASPRAMRRATWNAAVLAVLWAVLPVGLFATADGPQQLLLGTVITGMMCAGGFALATTPVAGTTYVVILGLAAAAALVRTDLPNAWVMSGLLFVYMVIVIVSVWSTARLFGARLMAEAEAERQNEVIGLLLRDFEENASDLLWEVGLDGRLCHPSPRLVALLGRTADALMAQPILELLAPLVPADDPSAANLALIARHFETGQAFRDVTLAIAPGARMRWWSLTAKPVTDSHGRPAGWRGVATDITDAQQANRQLTWLAHFDALTGLANRHQFRTQLAELLAPAFGQAPACAVLCLDLDHFKTINDTLGHAVGDALLQEVAQRLRARTRRSDTVARLGGDEFAVILRDVSTPDEAATLTRRVLEGLQAPCEVQGASIAVRASIGVAMAPRDGREIDALLNHADLALYAAKSAGRGEFRFFAPQMAAQTRRRLVVEQELRAALDRRELSLAFQPQVDLATWRITGFEALLRWRHPELGEVSPAEFVPVAEEAGLIAALGEWVLAQACREAVAWPGGLTVAVNVSPVQAMSQDLARIAQAELAASGLAPQRLELEITESIFLDESRNTLQVLHGLREAGLRVALDDFGTGYSSLAYLRRFPFDTLKIDRSFVRELMQRRDARAIVKMIVGLARTLNMKTLAEGVEEPAQASTLRHYGCAAMQGYLVARPMPASAVLAFLRDWRELPPDEAVPADPSNLSSLPADLR